MARLRADTYPDLPDFLAVEVRVRGLEAKRVLITGGASGIGAATAARFLEEGSVVCVLDRDAEARRKIRSELGDLAGSTRCRRF